MDKTFPKHLFIVFLVNFSLSTKVPQGIHFPLGNSTWFFNTKLQVVWDFYSIFFQDQRICHAPWTVNMYAQSIVSTFESWPAQYGKIAFWMLFKFQSSATFLWILFRALHLTKWNVIFGDIHFHTEKKENHKEKNRSSNKPTINKTAYS